MATELQSPLLETRPEADNVQAPVNSDVLADALYEVQPGLPDGPQEKNPFLNSTRHISSKEGAKMILMLPVALLRGVVIFLLFVMIAVWGKICTIGHPVTPDPETEVSPCSSRLQY